MNHFPIPEALAPENMIPRVRNAGLDTTLNNLAARGILLNTWQAAELIGEGNRNLGKTFVSYVKAAEASLENGGKFNYSTVTWQLDPDASNYSRKKEWLDGFYRFICDYYSDAFTVIRCPDHTFNLIPKLPNKLKSTWWNQ